MSLPVAQVGAAKNISSTNASVSAGACQLLGFYVNSTTTGTLILDDGGSAISGTITPAIGWHTFPAQIGSKLGATIANTLNVTFFFSTGN